DGLKGNRRDPGYPPPGSRGRFRGAMTDLRATVHGAPETARALTTAIRQMVRRRHELLGSGAPQRPVTAGEAGQHSVVVPAITVHVDLDDWDARAKALNGTRHALVAGFAAKLAQQMGRVRASDGAVTLTIP